MNRSRLRPRLLGALTALVVALAPALPGTVRAIAATTPDTSRGYWFVATDGGIFSYGDAGFHGSTGAMRLNQPVVGMAPTPTGKGYWFVASDGGIFSFGDAAFYGSAGKLKLNRPIVGMTASPTGRGYWFVATDGGIFSYGDAKFYGSTGNMKLNSPIVGMAATPTGRGYWLVAADGGIFSYGDAKFHGSGTGSRSPIVGMASTPSGQGYWFVAADGGVFPFGDAGFFGSMGGKQLKSSVVAMAPTASGRGYWLTGADGGIFSFGDAGFFGSTGNLKLNRPIVGMAATRRASGLPGGSGSPVTTTPGTPTTVSPGGPTTTTPPGPTTSTTLPPSSGNPVNWGAPGTTTLVKAATGGGTAFRPWMSADGCYVAFDSTGKRVIGSTPDTIQIRDVYVYNCVSKAIERISVASDGTRAHIPSPCNDQVELCGSQRPTISADGRYVAFWSDADNLVAGDTNDTPDSFVHDRQTHQTIRISVGPGGVQADDESDRPVISRDGRYIAFESFATNLVAAGGPLGGVLGGGDTNDKMDVFLYEMATGAVTRVSLGANAAQGNDDSKRPSISANGRRIVFESAATNLVAGDTNGEYDIFMRDLDSGATTRISTAAGGTQADKTSNSPSISADGNFVSFDTRATNFNPADSGGDVDVYIKNIATGAIEQVSLAPLGAQPTGGTVGGADSSISSDGRFVAFWSDAPNLDPNDHNATSDVFVRDRQAGTTKRASVTTAGVEAPGNSLSPALSGDGRYVAFDSKANFDGGSTDGSDVFVHAN